MGDIEKNLRDFGTQFVNAGIASPFNGLVELADKVPGVKISQWHPQVGDSGQSIGGKLGAAAGALVDITALALLSKAGFEAAGFSTRTAFGSALSLGTAGAVYGGVFSPDQSGDPLMRFKKAALGGVSFAAMGGVNSALDALAFKYRLPATMSANALIGAGTELAYEPLVNHRSATAGEVAQQAATYGLLSGGLSTLDYAIGKYAPEGGNSSDRIARQPVESDKPVTAPFSSVERVSNQPLVFPKPGTLYSKGAFNPTVLQTDDGAYHMLFRGQDETGISRIFYAHSADGIHYDVQDEPVLSPRLPDETKGIEDPRLFRNPDYPNEYWLTATAYNGEKIQQGLWKSTDLKNWEPARPDSAVIVPLIDGLREGQTKAANILPERINGQLWMYIMRDYSSGSDQLAVMRSEDGLNWQEVRPGQGLTQSGDAAMDGTAEPVLPRRPGMFDERVVEPGPPVIKTDKGWLLLYNGGNNALQYRVGWALFDLNDPSKLIARSNEPILEPKLEWEQKPAAATEIYQAPNVVFAEGLANNILLYGAADSYVGGARVVLNPYELRVIATGQFSPITQPAENE